MALVCQCITNCFCSPQCRAAIKILCAFSAANVPLHSQFISSSSLFFMYQFILFTGSRTMRADLRLGHWNIVNRVQLQSKISLMDSSTRQRAMRAEADCLKSHHIMQVCAHLSSSAAVCFHSTLDATFENYVKSDEIQVGVGSRRLVHVPSFCKHVKILYTRVLAWVAVGHTRQTIFRWNCLSRHSKSGCCITHSTGA